MKHLLALLFALAAAPLLRAATVPDIVWRTNAHPNLVSALRFLPDSRSLVSASFTGAAMLWSVSNTALHRSFSISRDHVVAIALSPDGTRLVGSALERFRMWRVSDGAVLYDADAYYTPGLAFSPKGDFIATGRAEGSSAVGLSPVNGESIGNGILYDDIIDGGINSLAFSPDGTLLLFGGNGSIAKLMRVSDGVVFQTFGHSRYVLSVAFSPNGKTLATGTHAGDVRLWSTNGTLLHTLGTGGPTRSMDFSPDGKLLATTSGDLVHFWRVSDGAPLVTYDPDPAGQVSAVDVSPDGKLFAYGTGIGALVLARMPALITETQRVGNASIVCWQGGTGRYQLQMRTSLNVGAWQDFGGATTNTCATNAVAATNAFFRVLSLPNP
jgi:WD40 repeat protein